MKRWLSLFLTVAMVAAMVGCGDKNSTESSETKKESTVQESSVSNTGTASSESEEPASLLPLAEPKTFSMFAVMPSVDMLFNENPSFMWACDNANVYFDVTQCSSADLNEQKNLLLASNDYPEVFFKASLGDGYEYGSQGVFLPLEDLIREYMPNLCTLLDEANGWKYIEASDGHVYTLPELQGSGLRDVIGFINLEWLDNLGLEMPTDLDSLYNVLKAFKEKDANGDGDPNDEVPWLVCESRSLFYLLQHFGYNYKGHKDYYAINEKDEIFFIANSDEWKEYITYIKKLYDEELVNQDLFTISLSEMRARHAAYDDVTVGMVYDYTPGNYINADLKAAGGVDQYRIMPPFTEGTLPIFNGIIGGTLAITDKCENPEIILAWVDQYYGEEGAIISKNGVEGISWAWNADGTWTDLKNDKGESMINGYTKIQGTTNHPGLYPTEFMSKQTGQSICFANQNEIVAMGAEPWPPMVFTEEEQDTLSVIKTDIYTYVWEYVANVVTGKADLESTWDNYLKTLNDMGLEDMNKIMSDVYARGMN